MYIFFASTGAVSNIVIDDEELRQGNVNVNNVYAYFASRPNISYTGTVAFERSDGLLSPERTMTPATFVYATVSYAGYHFLIDDEWILATYGELKCTVRLRSGAGAVLASGLITANVEQTVYEDEPVITITQYNDLTADIADKASKSQTVIHVATFDDIPYLDAGTYANWLFILDDGSLYRVDTDSATFVGMIGSNVKYVKSTEILAKGDVVQLATATGGFVSVKKAVSSEVNIYPQLILGIATQAFTANGFGLILMLGYLSGINTSSGTGGAYIYANTGSATNGLWTVTRPTAPNAIVILGTISNASANGSIDVRITPLPFSEQINHKTVPTNYTATTQTVKDNLIGIDTKLGVIDARTLAGTLLSTNINATQLTALINEATTSLKGLMSATDKTNLNTLVALLANNDGDSVINTVTEILAIFSTYPEGVNIVTALATKVESTDTTFADGLVIVQDGAVAKKVKQSTIPSAKLVTTDDTSAVDATIVVQDGTTGKKYKKSAYTIATLPVSTPQQTALNLKLDTKVNSFGFYSRIKSLFGSSILAFYPLFDFEGTTTYDLSGNARNGVYRTTGVSWVKSTFNDNQPCIKIDGTSGLVNIKSTALVNAFDFNEGSFSIACQVEGTFGDGITRYILNIYGSESGYINIKKTTLGISFSRKSASGIKVVGINNQATGAYGFQPNKPIILTATWSVAKNEMKLYIDGILVGSETTLESIVDTPFYMVIGASIPTNGSNDAFKGYIANAILLNRPMLKKEIDVLTEVANTEIKKLLVIGDSITNDNTDFPTYVVNNATKNVFGRSFGVAGNTIANHLATQTSLAVAENADYILLELGTNDNNAGDMSALQVILEAQINRLIVSNPRASIYYLNVFPCWTDAGGGTPIDKSNIRTAIASACASTGITCVDVSTWLIASYTGDGVHPTSNGSLLIAQQIIALLGL